MIRCINDPALPCRGCGLCVLTLAFGCPAPDWIVDPERRRLLMFDPSRRKRR